MIGLRERLSSGFMVYFTAMSIADIRRVYAHARLDEANVNADPIAEFDLWFKQALEAKVLEPWRCDLPSTHALEIQAGVPRPPTLTM